MAVMGHTGLNEIQVIDYPPVTIYNIAAFPYGKAAFCCYRGFSYPLADVLTSLKMLSAEQ